MVILCVGFCGICYIFVVVCGFEFDIFDVVLVLFNIVGGNVGNFVGVIFCISFFKCCGIECFF